MELYINGVHHSSKSWQVDTGTFAFGREADGENGIAFSMGTQAGYYLTKYAFDEIAIYDETLTHSQIQLAVGDFTQVGDLASIGTNLDCWWRMENKIEGSNNIENSADYLSNKLLSIGSNELIEDVPPS